MIVSIHQPHYFPWLRYINKIASSKVFVIYDDVKYQKNGWINRTMIRNQTPLRLVIPVHSNGMTMISEVQIVNDIWKVKHIKTIQYAYAKSPYFKEHFDPVRDIIMNSQKYLAEINIDTILWIVKVLGLKTKVILSSELKVGSSGTKRLVEICQKVGADTYLTGKYALNTYLDPNEFKSAGIRLVYSDFECKTYPQMKHKDFISDLSIIDLLMNLDVEQCVKYISNSKLIEV